MFTDSTAQAQGQALGAASLDFGNAPAGKSWALDEELEVVAHSALVGHLQLSVAWKLSKTRARSSKLAELAAFT